MANNRMYLLHIPSGKSIRLGKRMGWDGGYYDPPTEDELAQFFADCSEASTRAADADAFVVEFEMGRTTKL